MQVTDYLEIEDWLVYILGVCLKSSSASLASDSSLVMYSCNYASRISAPRNQEKARFSRYLPQFPGRFTPHLSTTIKTQTVSSGGDHILFFPCLFRFQKVENDPTKRQLTSFRCFRFFPGESQEHARESTVTEARSV